MGTELEQDFEVLFRKERRVLRVLRKSIKVAGRPEIWRTPVARVQQ